MTKESKEEYERKQRERLKKRAEKEANVEDPELDDDMLAYVDEDGNIVSTPPDPSEKDTVDPNDIVVGVPKKGEFGPEETAREGKVKFFNDEKGFGFIKDSENQQEIFVHISDCRDDIQENDQVTFEVEKTPKGLGAKNVKRL